MNTDVKKSRHLGGRILVSVLSKTHRIRSRTCQEANQPEYSHSDLLMPKPSLFALCSSLSASILKCQR